MLTLTLDASAPEVTQPGDYGARLARWHRHPLRAAPTSPSRLHVKPAQDLGEDHRTSSGRPAERAPPPAGRGDRADRQLDRVLHPDHTPPTARYGLWLDTRNNPLTVIVAKDGYQPTVATVRLKKGAAVTYDVTLKQA